MVSITSILRLVGIGFTPRYRLQHSGVFLRVHVHVLMAD